MLMTLFDYQEGEVITDLPLPPLPPEVTQLTFSEIRQADWNPVYPDWIVVQIRGYTPEITLADQGVGTDFPITFIYNLQTSQMLSLDALFGSRIATSPIKWSPDGKALLIPTPEVIGGKRYIVAFEHDGQDWTLSVVDGAPSEFQTALDWLGAGDLILSGTIDSGTRDRVRYIAQIIDGNWHYTEFFRLPASMFDRTGNGDWHITASDEERRELSCLFDQAQSARFGVGDRARVNFTTGTPLRLREAPDLDAAEIMQMPEGTEFDVIGGPACVNASDYYRFWQIELDDTITGWAAEAGMTDYFMEPVLDVVPTADAGPDQTVTAADGIYYESWNTECSARNSPQHTAWPSSRASSSCLVGSATILGEIVNIGFTNGGAFGTEHLHYTVYIDWNDDGIFQGETRSLIDPLIGSSALYVKPEV
jgi:hypothetical protein